MLWLGGAEDGTGRVMSSVALSGFEGCRDMKSKANWEERNYGVRAERCGLGGCIHSDATVAAMRSQPADSVWTRDARCVRRT